MGSGAGRPGQAAQVRVLRERTGSPGSEHRVHHAARPAAPGRTPRAQAPGGAPVTWTPVCRYDDLQPERGVAALIGGEQVAVFRLFDGVLYAIGNQDPLTGAFVLSRGIVGTRGDTPTVASPLHKQVFDLRTGACLDDNRASVPVFGVRERDGRVEVDTPAGNTAGDAA